MMTGLKHDLASCKRLAAEHQLAETRQGCFWTERVASLLVALLHCEHHAGGLRR